MADYEVSIEIKRLRRRERLNYYAEKVRREGPAYSLIEQLNTILTEVELKDKLNDVRRFRLFVEQTIKLKESSGFLLLVSLLNKQVQRVSQLRKYRIALVSKKWKRRSRGVRNKIESLKQEEDLLIDQALDTELQIVDICDGVQVDPLPYLLIHKVVGESYVLEEA